MRIKSDERYFDLDGIGGWKDLLDAIDEMPKDYTCLIPPLGDNDPDDAFSRIPYEKGFCLLFALEKRVGVDMFDRFTKAYFEEFKFLTVTTNQFRSFFETYFRDVADAQTFDWETWLHKPGAPVEKPDFDRTLAEESEELALEWILLDEKGSYYKVGADCDVAPTKDITQWSTLQTTCFLDEILVHCATRQKALKESTVNALKNAYGFDCSRNAEILFRFCRLAIDSGKLASSL